MRAPDFFPRVTSSDVFDMEVHTGDVFFYRSITGREFVVAILDIQQGGLFPNFNTLNIIFTEFWTIDWIRDPNCR